MCQILVQAECVCQRNEVAIKLGIIATLDLEERLILEDGPSGLIQSELTNRPPTHPPTHPRADGLFRSNHWSDLIQMLNLDLGNQSELLNT